MKKLLKIASLLVITAALLAGCSSGQQNEASQDEPGQEKVITIGATPIPHAEILEFVKPKLEEQGIKLEIKEFNDYVTPNLALSEGELDANFFQHIPYMEDFAAEHSIDIVSAGKVHVEPMGGYSNKIKEITELSSGAVIAVPNDPTNEGRALLLLQSQGLIKLKDEDGLSQTPKDIVENPKNIQFKELEAAQLPRVLEDVELAVINTNYALKGGLNPVGDSLFVEDKDSPYVNIVTVRGEDVQREEIKALIEALNSEEVKGFIEEKYEGAILPAF